MPCMPIGRQSEPVQVSNALVPDPGFLGRAAVPDAMRSSTQANRVKDVSSGSAVYAKVTEYPGRQGTDRLLSPGQLRTIITARPSLLGDHRTQVRVPLAQPEHTSLSLRVDKRHRPGSAKQLLTDGNRAALGQAQKGFSFPGPASCTVEAMTGRASQRAPALGKASGMTESSAHTGKACSWPSTSPRSP